MRDLSLQFYEKAAQTGLLVDYIKYSVQRNLVATIKNKKVFKTGDTTDGSLETVADSLACFLFDVRPRN